MDSMIKVVKEYLSKLQIIMLSFLILILTISIVAIGSVTYKIFEISMIEDIAKSRIDVLSQISERISTIKYIITTYSDLYYFNQPLAKDICTMSDSDEVSKNNIIRQLNEMNQQYQRALITNGIPLNYTIVTKYGLKLFIEQ